MNIATKTLSLTVVAAFVGIGIAAQSAPLADEVASVPTVNYETQNILASCETHSDEWKTASMMEISFGS